VPCKARAQGKKAFFVKKERLQAMLFIAKMRRLTSKRQGLGKNDLAKAIKKA
jgi:hypothetical protein